MKSICVTGYVVIYVKCVLYIIIDSVVNKELNFKVIEIKSSIWGDKQSFQMTSEKTNKNPNMLLN